MSLWGYQKTDLSYFYENVMSSFKKKTSKECFSTNMAVASNLSKSVTQKKSEVMNPNQYFLKSFVNWHQSIVCQLVNVAKHIRNGCFLNKKYIYKKCIELEGDLQLKKKKLSLDTPTKLSLLIEVPSPNRAISEQSGCLVQGLSNF